MDDAPLGYPVEVWRRFRARGRAGLLSPTDEVRRAEVGTVAGRFRLGLGCRIEAGRIAECRFQAYGCPYTIATGDWLAEWCEGRPLDGIAVAPIADLRAALEIPEDRAHCWLMAQDVLRALTDVCS